MRWGNAIGNRIAIPYQWSSRPNRTRTQTPLTAIGIIVGVGAANINDFSAVNSVNAVARFCSAVPSSS